MGGPAEFLPPYRQRNFPFAYARTRAFALLAGTDAPNRQEELFWFWRNGPNFLRLFVQTSLFLNVQVFCSWFVALLDSNELLVAWYLPAITVVLVLLAELLWALPWLLERFVIVCNVDLMRNDSLWERTRTEARRQIASLFGSLLDQVKRRACLHKFKEADEEKFAELRARFERLPLFERREIDKAFETFDFDQDGFISKEATCRCLASVGCKVSPEEAREWYFVFDFNHSGQIEADEFRMLVMCVMEVSGRVNEEDLFELFSSMDASKDGRVDAEGLAEIFEQCGVMFEDYSAPGSTSHGGMPTRRRMTKADCAVVMQHIAGPTPRRMPGHLQAISFRDLAIWLKKTETALAA